jgi:hypothetical protein
MPIRRRARYSLKVEMRTWLVIVGCGAALAIAGCAAIAGLQTYATADASILDASVADRSIADAGSPDVPSMEDVNVGADEDSSRGTEPPEDAGHDANMCEVHLPCTDDHDCCGARCTALDGGCASSCNNTGACGGAGYKPCCIGYPCIDIIDTSTLACGGIP